MTCVYGEKDFAEFPTVSQQLKKLSMSLYQMNYCMSSVFSNIKTDSSLPPLMSSGAIWPEIMSRFDFTLKNNRLKDQNT
jgi:hypothetical protein